VNRTHLLSTLLLVCLLLMAGCAPATPEHAGASETAATVVAAEATLAPLPTDTPAPTDEPEPTVASAAQPLPTDTPAPAPNWTQTVAQVEGLYVRGNPDAPIRLIDYSDSF